MDWKNKEDVKEYNRKYKEKNGDKKRKQQRKRYKEKCNNDPLFRELCSERARKYYSTSRSRRLKLRFDIFKRDNFTCQYCGRKAPDVILQIDHIHPKSKGGLNEDSNYATACFECNIGKSDSLL